MTDKSLKIGFIGAGRMGTALAVGLDTAGYDVTAVASRSFSSAELLAGKLSNAVAAAEPQRAVDGTDLVFITTPDGAITETAGALHARPGQMFCHVSAATSREALGSLVAQGAATGVFHPLQSAASPRQAAIQPGITFAAEAAEPLLNLLKTMAVKLGGRVIELSADDRVLYHASAVMASAYLVTLAGNAAALWQTFADKEQAMAALLPLIRGTVDNMENIGIPGCLTGPVARGDTATVRTHLEALAGRAPEALNIYRRMAMETIPLAAAAGGLDRQGAAELRQLLENE